MNSNVISFFFSYDLDHFYYNNSVSFPFACIFDVPLQFIPAFQLPIGIAQSNGIFRVIFKALKMFEYLSEDLPISILTLNMPGSFYSHSPLAN